VARRADEPLPLVIAVPPGREVIRQGEPYPGAWVVRTGALVMEVVDHDGHTLALDVLGPGDLVGGPPDVTADASVRALVTSGLFGASASALRAGLDRRARRVTGLASSLAWDRLATRLATGSTISLPVSDGRCLEAGRWRCRSPRNTWPR
jgi:CRP-like cAMP-binding protein